MSEEIKEFFKTYTDFVTKVTSDPSLDLEALNESFKEIENKSEIKKIRRALEQLEGEPTEIVDI